MERKNQRNKTGAPLWAALGLAGMLLLASGCDNFMIDDDGGGFKKGIEDEVWEANAPPVAVRFLNSV
ncbi:MAG: hypothetical protein LBQ67_04570, partial [Treponema sp.]|nr:hypothetical protein [Treponema sp.]